MVSPSCVWQLVATRKHEYWTSHMKMYAPRYISSVTLYSTQFKHHYCYIYIYIISRKRPIKWGTPCKGRVWNFYFNCNFSHMNILKKATRWCVIATGCYDKVLMIRDYSWFPQCVVSMDSSLQSPCDVTVCLDSWDVMLITIKTRGNIIFPFDIHSLAKLIERSQNNNIRANR